MTIIVGKSQATIEVLHESNFKKWNEDVRFAFVMAEIDIVLRVPKLIAITADSTASKNLFYEKWDRANLMCLYTIRKTVFEHLLSGLNEIENTKAFYDAVGERYHKSSKSEARNLMSELTSMRYDSSGCVISL